MTHASQLEMAGIEVSEKGILLVALVDESGKVLTVEKLESLDKSGNLDYWSKLSGDSKN